MSNENNNKKPDTAGSVHRKLYGKSDKANARENQGREFQDGYRTGANSVGYGAMSVIKEELHLRVEVGDDLMEGFDEWKRGFWSARSQLILCPKRKRPQVQGTYFGERSDQI